MFGEPRDGRVYDGRRTKRHVLVRHGLSGGGFKEVSGVDKGLGGGWRGIGKYTGFLREFMGLEGV